MEGCVRDLWCRCPQCYEKNYRYDPRAGIKPPDPRYGRHQWKETHGSGRPVAAHEYAVGKVWNAERDHDFRCFRCEHQCASADGGLIRRTSAPRGGIHYPEGFRIGLCRRCRRERMWDIRALLWSFGARVPMSPQAFLKAGKGRKTDRHRTMLSYALSICELAGATRGELVEVTGLDKATVSRLITQPTAPRPLIQLLFKLSQAFGLGQVGERRRRYADLIAARVLPPGRHPYYWAYHGHRELEVQERPDMHEAAIARIERKIDSRFDRVETKLDKLTSLIHDARNGQPDDEAIARAVEDLIADTLAEAA